MQVRDDARHAAIDLLGEGLPFVVRPQACFDVSHLDAAVIGEQCGNRNRRGVALNQYPVGLKFNENGIEMGEDGGAQFR